MKRRAFITLLGGSAAAWPLAAWAQQGERVRRIGVLLPWAADDPEVQARIGAFLQGLQQSGWTIGRNIRVDTRWSGGDGELYRRQATELAASAPDVILVPTFLRRLVMIQDRDDSQSKRGSAQAEGTQGA
jgi:putative tryptophan/tyrosine transport system substrate-binding protein